MRIFCKQKYWEVHPGKNKFYCGGRCLSATNVSVLCLSFWLIVVTSALFFAFDCRYMAQYCFLIPVFAVLLFISVISTLMKTALSDPGIIPRATISEAEWIESEIAKSINASQTDQTRPYVRIKEVYINHELIKLKYCTTCKIFRPPRSSHCSVCDNCVERFDHHCPWVGNCIGKRNYRYFFFFNFFLTIYCLYILAVSISNLALLSIANKSLVDALKQSPTSIAVIVVAFFSMISVIGLSGFHCNLIYSEISTNEDLKGSYKKLNEKNPFNRGNGFKNCAWVICGPRQPSLLLAREEIDILNLPIGSTYRGPDGCLIGPVGPTKTFKSFIEDEYSRNENLNTVPIIGPPEFEHVNYPRQTYILANCDSPKMADNNQGLPVSIPDKERNGDIPDQSCHNNYGTIHPLDLSMKE